MQRSLILDYLTHNAYADTARAFSDESRVRHLDADGDDVARPDEEADSGKLSEELLAQAQLRQEVQQYILSGKVDGAIARLNEHFPAVLDRASPDQPPTVESVPGKPPPPIRSIVPYTVDPARLFLELRILAFIEASRTIPLTPAIPTHASTSISEPDTASDAIPTPTSANGKNADAHLMTLLNHVYELGKLAKELPDVDDRVEYEEELARVSLLLAHKVPETSPVARYLKQERREEVAKQIECAMLYRAGLSPVSKLEICARQTCAVWGYMADHKYQLPPNAKIPDGLRLPTPRRPRDIDDNEVKHLLHMVK
ncbi:hypothetical protein PENSPDRAFT_580825 [Peniophora sp. CONT]|nr:hypothetical protein PENSPDRAFT_580825 [Peniophora sp. CONT]